MGHHEKTKHMNNRDRKSPTQKHRKYIQQNHRRKLFQPKERYPYESTRSLQKPNRLDRKKSSHHIIIKTLILQNKERILQAAKEKGQVTHKGRPIRITPDFSMETLKARRSWTDVLQTKRPWMKAQPTTPSKVSNHHRWRK